ncbi:hypothetical protein K504DRAFT_183088 [Pleomassaria siparia CBS 279.74]|uniref:Uncharacterized protein n=1 Tax=Pleomassaria siparia CBS 279.74 TaxID=1314801 RepID=A0A6G1JT53_9PLEO|nr:hypothetical protein K504DRAFT_183088 [Pleomassaria siparia CBS 279.74]
MNLSCLLIRCLRPPTPASSALPPPPPPPPPPTHTRTHIQRQKKSAVKSSWPNRVPQYQACILIPIRKVPETPAMQGYRPGIHRSRDDINQIRNKAQ